MMCLQLYRYPQIESQYHDHIEYLQETNLKSILNLIGSLLPSQKENLLW